MTWTHTRIVGAHAVLSTQRAVGGVQQISRSFQGGELLR